MKLIAFTPVWGRHEILEIWVEGVRRLRKNFDITPAVMVSNRDDYWFMRLAEGQGFYPYVFSVPNNPLGRKQNIGLNYCRAINFDYIVQISSNLLLTDKGMEKLLEQAPAQVISFGSAYFVKDGRAVRFIKPGHKAMGACRMIHRSVCEGNNFMLWDDELNRNLDHSSQQRMPPPVIVKGTHVVGVKSEVQITPFENLEKLGETVDFDKALRGLGEKEIELIKNL